MKKQMILRGLLGFPLGIAIGYVITIIISLIWAHGYYSPVIPDLIDYVGSEIYAVILQNIKISLCKGKRVVTNSNFHVMSF